MKKVIVLILVIVSLASFSQKKVEEKAVIPAISVDFGYQIPGGDMATRFGNNYNVGGTFWLKLKNNFILGLDGYYLFGDELKEEAYNTFDGIKTSDGNITDKYGHSSTILMTERGYYFGLKVGKLFPLTKGNGNTGIIATVGGGFLEHHILIENDGNRTPQILDEYKKGYDKLVNGFAFQEFIGYMYMGKSRLLNFIVGLEFTQGFTKSRRSYDFNLMKYNDKKRLDLLYGIKVSWLIPFRKRMPADFYYN